MLFCQSTDMIYLRSTMRLLRRYGPQQSIISTNSFSFIVKGNSYVCDATMLATCLHLPANNCDHGSEPKDTVETLELIGYNGEMSNLRKNYSQMLKKIMEFFL